LRDEIDDVTLMSLVILFREEIQLLLLGSLQQIHLGSRLFVLGEGFCVFAARI
jgi:hypothetical protein